MALRQQIRPPATNGSRGALDPPGGVAIGTRSVPLALVGVASVVVGALVFLGLYTSLDRRQAVLVVARDVSPGQVLTAEDLTEARVSVSEGAAWVPASQRVEVIGQPAAVGLAPGAILAPSQLGESSGLRADQAEVGVVLKPGQAPLALRKGSRVEIIDNGRDAAGSQARPVVLSKEGVVSDVGVPSATSATTVVSLTVPQEDAAAVAAAGAAGRVSLVVLASS
jgi:hypothetical protein